jgi:8-oxo-dGTP pyrophosphatase MutT (NUDIX family)
MHKYSKIIGNILYWLSWPALFFYLRNSRRCRAIVIDGDNILIIRNWLGSGAYTLPGGGLRSDEDPKQGIVRELEEETGIIVAKDSLTLIKPQYLAIEKGHSYQCFGYYVDIDKHQQITRQRYEIAEIKWVDKAEVLEKYRLTLTARDLISSWLGDDHLLD